LKAIAVIGAGFGDEGKGKVVSNLCSRHQNPLVVRFCGGQQAGHNVMLNKDVHHTFSNFGSGTLQGVPTYWSRFCTIDPVGILNELDLLRAKGFNPVLFIDKNCPITTPFDKEWGKRKESFNNHGTCGVGVGQTYERESSFYSITAYDLLFSSILKIKLDQLTKYYYSDNYQKITTTQHFLRDCEALREEFHGSIKICENFQLTNYKTIIFEGAQGLLLDQHYGFFPNVTRGNTGLKNIIEILGSIPDEIYYVTRAYQTRHGNGPMTNKEIQIDINNPYEKNTSDGLQGEFRKSILDLDLLKYALGKERNFLTKNNQVNLLITCLDVLKEFKFTLNGKIFDYSKEEEFLSEIKDNFDWIDNIYVGRSPFYDDLEKV